MADGSDQLIVQRDKYVYRGLWDAELVQIKTFNRFNLCWAWGHASQKVSTPNCPPHHLHVVPLWKLSAWWTTELSLVLEVCGYSIFATRPVPVAQDRYPYPYPIRTQNYYPT